MEPMSDYAGDLSPRQAWDMLADAPGARLVDVRTSAEWGWVGQPVLDELNSDVQGIEWTRSDGTRNDGFVDELCALDVDDNAPLLFLCRSGVRSIAAAKAATAAGLGPAYNILGGFEGDKDEEGHRGTVAGWKVEGLPWRQG